MSDFLRASLGADFGYTPGEQPPDAEGWLKLNSNESPLPPSATVAAAVAHAAADLARYPSPVAEPLRSALARLHVVEPEQVFVANGADQVLDCCFRAYASPGDPVVRAEPGYSLLPVLAALFSVRDDPVGLEPDGSLPAEFALRPAVLRAVVNPNSPTGHWIQPADARGGSCARPEVWSRSTRPTAISRRPRASRSLPRTRTGWSCGRCRNRMRSPGFGLDTRSATARSSPTSTPCATRTRSIGVRSRARSRHSRTRRITG